MDKERKGQGRKEGKEGKGRGKGKLAQISAVSPIFQMAEQFLVKRISDVGHRLNLKKLIQTFHSSLP